MVSTFKSLVLYPHAMMTLVLGQRDYLRARQQPWLQFVSNLTIGIGKVWSAPIGYYMSPDMGNLGDDKVRPRCFTTHSTLGFKC
jgi:hypothetical protein